MISWRSLDLSPHGGIEWLMCGGSKAKVSELRFAYHVSQHIHARANGIEYVYPDDIAAVVDPIQTLQAILQLEADVGVGIGSGRSGLQ